MDPVTALATATTAFTLIKKGFQASKDVESMYGDIGRWMGAISDINHAEQMSKNPPIFKKIFAGASVEQEAMDAFAAKKKAQSMEDELRSWINMVHGPDSWAELLRLQTKIRKERAEQIYKQQELRKNIMNVVGILVLATVVGALIVWLAYLFYLKKQGDI
jgi:hypothetical protein|tara:strand:- start:683 stop:1165 length:483 start_codon:yes stop_codon:yes gene_type:complete